MPWNRQRVNCPRSLRQWQKHSGFLSRRQPTMRNWSPPPWPFSSCVVLRCQASPRLGLGRASPKTSWPSSLSSKGRSWLLSSTPSEDPNSVLSCIIFNFQGNHSLRCTKRKEEFPGRRSSDTRERFWNLSGHLWTGGSRHRWGKVILRCLSTVSHFLNQVQKVPW